MPTLGELLVLFVALYPVLTSALWMSGGILYRIHDEDAVDFAPAAGWPGVSILIPAYNEEQVIATTVKAALAADYPDFEVLVLDDGSADATSTVATEAAAGDPRCRVVRDEVNRGKAERLNIGLQLATHDLVAVTDADTHMHPEALKRLVARMFTSDRIAAVAGGPHVTNRSNFLSTFQVLEAATIIGLIRRTQALTGRVGVVAGVLALFRKERVLAVGGYDGRMSTEDIDLTWKLLLAGWETSYEPRALVGMEVPVTVSALWAQRKRWARGQGEVLRAHADATLRPRNHRMWLLAFESLASMFWVLGLTAAVIVALLGLAFEGSDAVGFGLVWGIAIAVIATLQAAVALSLDWRYEPEGWRSYLLEPLYPLAYWILGAAAAVRSETVGFVRGPLRERVVWDIPREQLDES